uniref:DUF3615 domain-containing protein n=1 Tax=Oryza glumipatula TaxID=40148 RepID=A0A0E0BDG1_9ORYZ
MYSPQPPSDGNPDDGALARPRRQLSTASAADSLAVFALAKLIDDRATHQADPQLALALAFAICARFQERSITFDSSSYHKLGDDSGAFTTKNDDDFSGSYFAGLQTWDDPTGPSDEYTFKELQDEFIAACKNCNLPWAYKMPMPEHLERLREQNECKMLEIPLHLSPFTERRKVYGHFNFLVKDSDGTHTLFFAEVDLNCKEEKDVIVLDVESGTWHFSIPLLLTVWVATRISVSRQVFVFRQQLAPSVGSLAKVNAAEEKIDKKEGGSAECPLNIVTPPLPNPDPAGAAGRRCRRSEGLRIMYLPSDRAPAAASPHPQPSTSAAAPLAGSSSRKPAASTQIVLNYSGEEDPGLQLLDNYDPTRPSRFKNAQELRDAFVAACQRDAKPFAEKWRLPEDLERLRRQDHCKMLKIALRVYAKQKNIPANWVKWQDYGDYGDSDDTLTLFFAEVDINCKEEKDVFLCCPLEANDNGQCFGSQRWELELKHPTCAKYLGGHSDVCYLPAEAMYSPQIPSDGNPDDDAEGALATRPHRRPSTASSAATSLAVFAVAKLIDRVTSTALVDPRLALALALALAICQRIQERSVTVYVTLDSSCRRKHCDFSEGDFAGLQIEDDPTPRLLSRYISDTGLYVTLMATYKSGVFPSSYEILFPEQQEEACKMVEIALHAYAKQKDMPPAKLEIMKVKERSLFEECGKVYAQFNFLVINDSDGTRTLFFAEVDFLNCKEEKDVYLCCPLEENDNGYCFGCRVQHIKLRRPTSADYLGGHKDICSEYIDVEWGVFPPERAISIDLDGYQVNALVAKSVAWNLGIPLLLTISVAIGISVLYSQI